MTLWMIDKDYPALNHQTVAHQQHLGCEEKRLVHGYRPSPGVGRKPMMKIRIIYIYWSKPMTNRRAFNGPLAAVSKYSSIDPVARHILNGGQHGISLLRYLGSTCESDQCRSTIFVPSELTYPRTRAWTFVSDLVARELVGYMHGELYGSNNRRASELLISQLSQVKMKTISVLS